VINMGDDGDIAYRLAHRCSSSFSSMANLEFAQGCSRNGPLDRYENAVNSRAVRHFLF